MSQIMQMFMAERSPMSAAPAPARGREPGASEGASGEFSALFAGFTQRAPSTSARSEGGASGRPSEAPVDLEQRLAAVGEALPPKLGEQLPPELKVRLTELVEVLPDEEMQALLALLHGLPDDPAAALTQLKSLATGGGAVAVMADYLAHGAGDRAAMLQRLAELRPSEDEAVLRGLRVTRAEGDRGEERRLELAARPELSERPGVGEKRELPAAQGRGVGVVVADAVAAARATATGGEGQSAGQQGEGQTRGFGAQLLPSTPAAAQAQLAAPITVPPGQPQWGQAVGERLVWMVGQKIQQVQIQLNPRHLGPLDIRVSVERDVVNVNFNAQHAVTREALEQAQPRLRELLAGQGLTLGEFGVSQQSLAGRDQPGSRGEGAAAAGHQPGNGGESTEEEELARPLRIVKDGLIDYYA